MVSLTVDSEHLGFGHSFLELNAYTGHFATVKSEYISVLAVYAWYETIIGQTVIQCELAFYLTIYVGTEYDIPLSSKFPPKCLFLDKLIMLCYL